MSRCLERITAVLIAVAILAVSIICVIQICREIRWNNDRVIIEYHVIAGDEINIIAARFKPSWMDLHEWVYEVCEINNMPSADVIYAGDVIKIPTLEGNNG